MAQAQLPAEESRRERTYCYQVTTGSGAMEQRYIVELSRPLQRNPNRPQESMMEQLRQAIRDTGMTGAEMTVRSVKMVNPITGNEDNCSLERFRQALHGEVFIAPFVRSR